MSELHKLIDMMKTLDGLHWQMMNTLGSHKHSESQQINDLKRSLWGRIDGAIDTEREQARTKEAS